MDFVNRFPKLIPESDNNHTFHHLLKVIAIRLDPCFSEGTGPRRCRQQIRLVWQPLLVSEGVVRARDAAIHTFYDMTEDQWTLLLAQWNQFPKTNERLPLQVHPLLKEQGLGGAYWKNLSSLVLQFCGEKNLSRVTGMNVMNGEQVWSFLGYNTVFGKEPERIEIPRIQHDIQGIIIGLGEGKEFNGRIIPELESDMTLRAVLQDSFTMKENLSEKEIRDLIGRIFEIENPLKHNPGTMDCVSCHIAQAVRAWGERSFQSWQWQTDFQTQRYQNAVSLENQSEQGMLTNQLRAIGYFETRSVISQRVINETAETLKLFQ